MMRVVKKDFPQWYPAYQFFTELKQSKGLQSRIMVSVPFQ